MARHKENHDFLIGRSHFKKGRTKRQRSLDGKRIDDCAQRVLSCERITVGGRVYRIQMHEEIPSGIILLSITHEDERWLVRERGKVLKVGNKYQRWRQPSITVPRMYVPQLMECFDFCETQNPYKEVVAGHKILKTSCYFSRKENRTLLVLGEAEVADTHDLAGLITIPVHIGETRDFVWSLFCQSMQRVVEKTEQWLLALPRHFERYNKSTY
eukprot:jgi/Botrbrau1/120/Bobra.0022s0106.1